MNKSKKKIITSQLQYRCNHPRVNTRINPVSYQCIIKKVFQVSSRRGPGIRGPVITERGLRGSGGKRHNDPYLMVPPGVGIPPIVRYLINHVRVFCLISFEVLLSELRGANV